MNCNTIRAMRELLFCRLQRYHSKGRKQHADREHHGLHIERARLHAWPVLLCR